ncbi:MAG: glutamate racemase [Candidatus Coatesbacteria bacterium]|nr:MAG: glutamate racemase [Candidatus Coatesbacteria bacterium]
MTTEPIAIFDSGVGGLTVAREVHRALPGEEMVYLGDTARVPYGPKSPRTVRRFAGECVEFLLHFRPKLVIIACNTASSVAMDYLAERVDVPLVGVIEPGAAAAVAATANRRVGVIGTKATVRSGSYELAIKKKADDVETYSNACPLFVPMVEEGRAGGPVVEVVAREYLEPLIGKGIDTLILGCTHYPVLKPVIQEVCGPDVNLVDSAEVVAAKVAEVLAAEGALADVPGTEPRFFVTDVVDDFVEVGRYIWPDMPGTVERVELGVV